MTNFPLIPAKTPCGIAEQLQARPTPLFEHVGLAYENTLCLQLVDERGYVWAMLTLESGAITKYTSASSCEQQADAWSEDVRRRIKNNQPLI
jgi:hypothetical protein